MKLCKKLSGLMKVLGVIFLFLAIISSIYALATSGSSWNELNTQLNANGVETGFFDRLRFNREYFSAMSEAAGNSGSSPAARSAAAYEHFAHYQDQVNAKADVLAQRKKESALASFTEQFDFAQFVKNYEMQENREELRNVQKAIEQLDALFKPAGKGGKKLAIAAKSCADTMEQEYVALTGRMEEAGTPLEASYCDYLRAVYQLLEADKAAGKTYPSVSDFLSTVTDEGLLQQISLLDAVEATDSDDLLDRFYTEVALPRQNGETVDVQAYFEALEQLLKERGIMAGSSAQLIKTVQSLLEGQSFDGSLTALSNALTEAEQAERKNGFKAFLHSFSEKLVEQSDKSAQVVFLATLWRIVANTLWLWALMILFLVLSLVLRKVVESMTMAMLEERPAQPQEDDVLLRVEHIKQYFRDGDFLNKAVDDVSFSIKRGEVLGLVGESGCGKTTVGRTIINLYDPTDGDVFFDGLRVSSTQSTLSVLLHSLRKDFRAKRDAMQVKLKEDIARQPEKKAELEAAYRLSLAEMKKTLSADIETARNHALESFVEKSKCIQKYREKRRAELTAAYEADCKTLTGTALENRKKRYEIDMRLSKKDNVMTRMQMIFQDPIASINPRMTVREIIAEGLRIRGVKDKDYIDEKVYEMLELVGLVREHADRYPHEFSGGQRQRIGIARAILLKPDLIIADEPISALDVSIQAQVINLLNDLRNSMGLTILFIAHNLSVVKYFSDRIAVMYFGKLVELATAEELFEHPLHPYTKSLLSAIPYPDPHYEKTRKRIEYNPLKAHDYSQQAASLHEITPGHFVHCNDAELENYKKELGL